MEQGAMYRARRTREAKVLATYSGEDGVAIVGVNKFLEVRERVVKGASSLGDT